MAGEGMCSFLDAYDVPAQGLLAQNGQNYRKLATKLINSLHFLDKYLNSGYLGRLCEAIQLVGLALCVARGEDDRTESTHSLSLHLNHGAGPQVISDSQHTNAPYRNTSQRLQVHREGDPKSLQLVSRRFSMP